MTAQLSRLHITVTRELLAKIEAAQLALSHARPGATIADILDLGAETALAQDAKRKGLMKRRKAPRTSPDSDRHPTSLGGGNASASCYGGVASASCRIPAEIRRAVWERDGGCCQWKMANGEICGSRYRLQFDHIEPKALGGQATVANVRLLCQRHNLLAARQAFGEKFVRRYRGDGARPSTAGAALRLVRPSSPAELQRPQGTG